MMTDPRTLSDPELVRYANSQVVQGLPLQWQQELIKRLDERVHKQVGVAVQVQERPYLI